MKELLRLLVIVLSAVPTLLQAQFSCSTNGDGTVTITGYSGPGGNITLPTTLNGRQVTGTASMLFYYNTTLTSVSVPGSITNLGMGTFILCVNMTNAVIGNGITIIPDDFFSSCSSLANITIPTNVTSIGIRAFWGTAIATFNIPPGVTSLSHLTFLACGALTNVTLPSGLTNFDEAFNSCSNLPGVIIPPLVTSIGYGTFQNCTSLTNIVIPTNITSLSVQAFDGCSNLRSIVIPSSVTNIAAGQSQGGGNYGQVFGHCPNLTNLVILGAPNIGTLAFYYNQNLTSVSLAGGVVGASAFQACTNLTSLTIGNLPTVFNNDAFEGSPIANLYIPANVTSIGASAFSCNLTNLVIAAGVANLGSFSFLDNFRLTNVLMLGNAPATDYGADGGPFTSCPATVYYRPKTTGWSNTFGATQYVAGVPTALWNPGIQNRDGHLALSNGMFGFTITNGTTTNIPIAVLTCTNLAHPIWTTLTNVTLSNSYYLTDAQSSNYPSRFYGIGFP